MRKREKNILIIATKLPVAMNFIKKVKANLKSMPEWLILPDIVGNSGKHLEFSNGSRITAIPTSADAGRSEALSLLIVDECISDSYITLRNKLTGEIKYVKINDVYESSEYK